MDVLYQSGMDAKSKGDLRTAQEFFQRALLQDPADDKVRLALGVTTLELGAAKQALDVLYPLVAKNLQDAELLTYYGIALKKIGRYDDAVRTLSRANSIQSSPRLQRELADSERLAANAASSDSLSSLKYRNSPDPPLAESNSPNPPLAESLDKSDISPEEMRGALKVEWRRRATSYLRLWLGGLLALGGLVLLLAGVPHAIGYSPSFYSVSNLHVYLTWAFALLLVIGLIMMVDAVLSAIYTRYTIYERRIDLATGVISRRQNPIWLYDITSIEFRQTPLLTLTFTASIEVNWDASEGTPRHQRIIGVAGKEAMRQYAEKLQTGALRERRAMKKMWV